MKTKADINAPITNLLLFLLGILLLVFPLIFTSLTSDPYGIPKQAILGFVSLIGLLFFGAGMLSQGRVKLRKTPYDLPLSLFTLAVFLSSVFSLAKADAIITFVPLFFAIVLAFLIVNTAKQKSSFFFLLAMFLIGASVTAVFVLLQTIKIYILPLSITHNQTFTPLGSSLDTLVYLLVALFVAIGVAMPLTRARQEGTVSKKTVAAVFAAIILLLGVLASAYQFFVLNNTLPLGAGRISLLPFSTGFQTAFAAISQDTLRPLQSFLLGSGFGTFATDFTRFHSALFNQQPDIWSLTFYRSSSFLLELLATTGVLGIATFLFLLFSIVQSASAARKAHLSMFGNPLFLAMGIILLLAIVIPFSYVLQTLFFLVLGLFAAGFGLIDKDRFYDVDMYFVSTRKEALGEQQHASVNFGFDSLPFRTIEEMANMPAQNTMTKLLPVTFFLVIILLVGTLGYYSTQYLLSDLAFQRSSSAYTTRDSLKTFREQLNAINAFRFRDGYFRVYSQLNLELASSLIASLAKEKNPDTRVQQTVYNLIQESINAGRSATSLAPLTVANWQNLASIYRSLFGVAKEAENFAIASAQRAVQLDPNNPQSYISLGGTYYQLGKWTESQQQFQIAVSLKPDFANAHYNLGHALEQQEKLDEALREYEAVKTLVGKDKAGNKKISEEIDTLKAHIGKAKEESANAQLPKQTTTQPPLTISTPSAQLPPQTQKVEVEGPNVATQSAQQ